MINNIKDPAVRLELEKINRRLDKIVNIPQVSKETTLAQLIDVVNKIISKTKRR